MLKHKQVKSDELIVDSIQEMLKEHLSITDIDFDANLSDTQKQAFKLFKEQENVLLLGAAGTGKSKLIKIIEEYIKKNTSKSIYLCSTTGISAYNIGGMTIHSFMGIGTGEQEINTLIRKVYRKPMYRDRIQAINTLVIDEASMLSGELFEKINIICQVIRKDKRFFGGIQIIFSMDPMQLLPVFNKNPRLYTDIDERLIIESKMFTNEFKNENTIVLTENFRQKNDPIFINLLSRIRDGTFTDIDIKLLNSRKILPDKNSKHVHLVSSNKKAQLINETELNKLCDTSKSYKSTFTTTGINKEIQDLLKKELEYQFKQKGITELTLKKNARVMLIKNLDTSIGLVNGALGTVSNLKPLEVTFDNGVIHIIERSTWDLEIDSCRVSALQIPLMLAYSLTTHKSQSLTLDSAVLDLGDAFCDAMVYVALSRLKSLDSMYLKSFNPKKITINKKMKEFLINLNK